MWLEVVYWIDHAWSSIECVCCACGWKLPLLTHNYIIHGLIKHIYLSAHRKMNDQFYSQRVESQ